VITGKDDDRDARRARPFGLLEAGEFACEVLEPTQRTGRFCQLCLARQRRIAVRDRDFRTFLSDPFGIHAALPCLLSLTIKNLTGRV
jgi:hypothetical protein